MFSLKVLPFEVGTFFLEKETVLYFHFVPVPCGEMLVRFLVPGTDLCGGNAGAVRGAGS